MNDDESDNEVHDNDENGNDDDDDDYHICIKLLLPATKVTIIEIGIDIHNQLICQ